MTEQINELMANLMNVDISTHKEHDWELDEDGNIDEHVNVICLRCGKIDDVNEDSLLEMESRVKRKSKYKILTSSFELYGYCESCKNKVN